MRLEAGCRVSKNDRVLSRYAAAKRVANHGDTWGEDLEPDDADYALVDDIREEPLRDVHTIIAGTHRAIATFIGLGVALILIFWF